MSEYTKVNLVGDVEDVAPSAGMEGVEARFAATALELEHSGISHQRLAPGARLPFGHRHRVQEEIYVVISGGGTAMLGSEQVPVRAHDAVRVAPQLARCFEAGPGGLELIAFGAPRKPGDTPAGEAEVLPGWWGDAAEEQAG